MQPDSFAQLIYLVLLGSVVTGYFLVSNRRGLGRVVQQAALWGFIFVGAILVVGLWEDLRRTTIQSEYSVTNDGAVVVQRARDGHFHLTAEINGQPIALMVDTGASDLVLTRADAARVGIDPDRLAFRGIANTANGRVRTAFVALDEMQLGPFIDRGVPAAVNDGQMPHSLMGMSYLSRFGRIEIVGNKMILSR
ncbi:MAG: TIGR02281 family clan AA aspartic protease [Rhodobacteraceae bacterium]|jgi:aspartyl protease family protein|nr:TIGR02281 family clan AA aspartic protease [Paracoccaceae bacterium]MBL4559241.1 TIGR02281 family clan AA aspartic protease [Paracoccaceae bacterium]